MNKILLNTLISSEILSSQKKKKKKRKIINKHKATFENTTKEKE
jgi:hypothetical protein